MFLAEIKVVPFRGVHFDAEIFISGILNSRPFIRKYPFGSLGAPIAALFPDAQQEIAYRHTLAQVLAY